MRINLSDESKFFLNKIAPVFVLWRVILLAVAFLATLIIPFGYTFPYSDKILAITKLPQWIWGFGNFDGVHYLRIAQDGYVAQYTQAFFPLYSLAIKFVASSLFVFLKDPNLDLIVHVDPSYFYSAIFLNIVLFPHGLFILYKLLNLDYKKEVSVKSLVLLISYPTAFYFAAIYSESLFLLLCVLALLFIRKKNFLLAALFIALASLTRIFGVLLIFSLALELFYELRNSKFDFKKIALSIGSLAISSLGLLSYMGYLKITFDKPFYFLSAQPFFGAQRTDLPLVFFPQVFFRYLKILLTVKINSLPFFNSALELFFALVFLLVIIYSFNKIRLSYWIFLLGCFLLPSMTGTFSSFPRYSLMMFLALPIFADKPYFKLLVILSTIFQAILFSIFIRGYWVA